MISAQLEKSHDSSQILLKRSLYVAPLNVSIPLNVSMPLNVSNNVR